MAIDRIPRVASEYMPGICRLVRQTCLEVATRLGDLRAQMCVVGGLVPSLIVDQAHLPPTAAAHIGTIDLDLGLSIVVLDERLYDEIAKRLRDAGFSPDTNPAGNLTTQRWRSREGITVDFLVPPSSAEDRGGRLRHLDRDLAAIVTPALDLAFEDIEAVELHDTLPSGGGTATRSIQVCGSAAFVVLKALAFDGRGKPKDAYDLFYVLRNHPDGVERIGARIRGFGGRAEVQAAIGILQRDFCLADSVGPVRVAEFLGGRDDDLQAEVAGFVRALLEAPT